MWTTAALAVVAVLAFVRVPDEAQARHIPWVLPITPKLNKPLQNDSVIINSVPRNASKMSSPIGTPQMASTRPFTPLPKTPKIPMTVDRFFTLMVPVVLIGAALGHIFCLDCSETLMGWRRNRRRPRQLNIEGKKSPSPPPASACAGNLVTVHPTPTAQIRVPEEAIQENPMNDLIYKAGLNTQFLNGSTLALPPDIANNLTTPIAANPGATGETASVAAIPETTEEKAPVPVIPEFTEELAPVDAIPESTEKIAPVVAIPDSSDDTVSVFTAAEETTKLQEKTTEPEMESNELGRFAQLIVLAWPLSASAVKAQDKLSHIWKQLFKPKSQNPNHQFMELNEVKADPDLK